MANRLFGPHSNDIGPFFVSTVAVPLGAVALFLLAWGLMGMTDRGRMTWARLVYAVPVVGTLVRIT